jgi:hypothetical protein
MNGIHYLIIIFGALGVGVGVGVLLCSLGHKTRRSNRKRSYGELDEDDLINMRNIVLKMEKLKNERVT